MKNIIKAIAAFFADFTTIKCKCGRVRSSVDKCTCEKLKEMI